MASSLTRKWVCSLECLHSLVRSLTTSDHTLPSHPRLCSLSVASYDSQGLRWKYCNPPPHWDSCELRIEFRFYFVVVTLCDSCEVRAESRSHFVVMALCDSCVVRTECFHFVVVTLRDSCEVQIEFRFHFVVMTLCDSCEVRI
jgi:hypothetical protein